MRSLKKVLALLTVIAMIFSTTAAFGATFKDVNGTDYEEAVVTLSSLKVLNGYEDGTFKPEGDITRAEFAKVVIAVMNMTASAGKTATSFTDVAADNWASGYVKLAEQMGIIKGYGNGKFGPDDKVTYEQAVKMIVAALGYTPKAEALGGYPTGYMVVAAQEEITKGVKADASKPAARGVVAKLVYNALEVGMMEQTGFGTDVTYTVPTDKDGNPTKTLLDDYLEVTKYEDAKVIANDFTALGNGTKAADGEIKIDKITTGGLEVNGTNAAQLLGYIVDVYVNEDDEIVSINEKDHKTLMVKRDDILDTDTAFSKTNFIYEDDKEEEVDVDIVADAYLIVNGKSQNKVDDKNDLVGKQVMLLDNDDDDTYDVVFVTNTKNYVVDEVISSRDKVVFKSEAGFNNTGSLVLDPDDDAYDFVIFKDGKEVGIGDLKEWDVLSIVESNTTDLKGETNELITVYVSSGNTVKGKVTETDDDKKYIDGKSYEVDSDNVTTGIALGDEGTFYIDFYGKIAGFDTTTESSNYAVILEAGSTSGIDSGWEMKLLNSKGEEVTLKLDDKVDFDGTANVEDQDVIEKLVTGLAARNYLTKVGGSYIIELAGNDRPAFITYELNSDGKIDEIEVVNDASDAKIDAKATYNTDKFNEDDNSIGSSFYVDEKTIVFNVNDSITDYDDYEVKGKSYFTDDGTYEAYAYDVDNGVAKFVLVTKSSSGTTVGTNYAVVEKVSTTKNDADDTVFRLRGFADGKAFDSLTDEDLSVAKNANVVPTALAGKLISYKTSGNVVDEYYVLADFESISTVYTTADNKDELVFGTVYEVTNRTVKVGNTNATSVYFTASSAKVYSYDKSEDEFTVIELNEISKEDKVFIYKYDGDVEVIVVIED